jgi:predicted DNA-binding transcriptional regulator YafY
VDSEFHRINHPIQINNVVDTLYIAREYFTLPSYTLTNLAAEFDIKNPEAHRALSDALTDKNVFFAMMDALKPSQSQLNGMVGIYNSPAIDPQNIQLPTEWWEAFERQQELEIVYSDKNGEMTQRRVRPIQVMQLQDYIYLRAYCMLRKDERTFRLDRIVSVGI